MRITANDLELHVAVDGPDDAPPLLLLHGIVGSHRTWDWLVPDLVGSWRVHRLDFRGHGESARAPGRYLPTDFLADAAAVCRHIGQPVTVIGHSLGGMVATGLVQQHRELVRAVVLEDPALRVARSEGASHALEGNALLQLFRVIHRVVPRLQASGMGEAALADSLSRTEHVDGRPVTEVVHPDVMAAWAYAQLRLDVGVLEPVLDGTYEADARRMIDLDQPIDVPGLLLAPDPSAPDGIIGEAQISVLARTSPQVRVEVVEGAGHTIHDDLRGREPMRRLVRDFLASPG